MTPRRKVAIMISNGNNGAMSKFANKENSAKTSSTGLVISRSLKNKPRFLLPFAALLMRLIKRSEGNIAKYQTMILTTNNIQLSN
jgi:hypothetical protein